MARQRRFGHDDVLLLVERSPLHLQLLNKMPQGPARCDFRREGRQEEASARGFETKSRMYYYSTNPFKSYEK